MYVGGQEFLVCDDSQKKNSFVVEIDSWHRLAWVLRNPRLRIGEAFQNGSLVVLKGDLAKLIELLFENEQVFLDTKIGKIYESILRRKFVKLQVYGVDQSIDNVHQHYDLGNDFYASFLDSEMVYSCGFFENTKKMEIAQRTKLNLAMQRCNTPTTSNFLEIGCGWGALSELAAKDTKKKVVALTLAQEQFDFCKKNRNQAIEFRMQDYRVHAEEKPNYYESIASIGMFEHVGIGQFETFFHSLAKMLKKDGKAVIHTIIRPELGTTNAWINKHIFPGGYIACEAEVVNAISNNKSLRLEATHNNWGHHYGKTLSVWRKHLLANKGNLPAKYDDYLYRSFEFYLAGSEAAFSKKGMHVAQFEISKI